MDSLSQLALGAAVSVAAHGRGTRVWKSALWGAIAGTLPDLDVLIDHGDPVSNMVLHRAESHAFFWQTLAAPLLAWTACRVHGEARRFGRWLVAVWLAFVTHAVLDAFTVYGTRLWLPFRDDPVALGSVFIIDPLYTLPLVVGLLVALRRSAARGAVLANAWGLALSSAYLAWTLAAQALVTERALDALRAQGLPHERVLVTPTPFNSILWRVVALEEQRYHEGFVGLLDGSRPPRFDAFPREPALLAALPGPSAARLAEFAGGFVRATESDGIARVADLRMGQEPGYVFEFALARRVGGVLEPLAPVSVGERGDFGAALRWIGVRMLGRDVPPPR
ncbi:MAG: metal-dependent hydrolase [Planctomycetes bacterium]|nr:metal-dependent hydrolase [Planctomycetota bacterium]